MSEAAFPIEGLDRTRKPSRSGLPLLVRITIILSIVFMVTAGAGIAVWLRAQGRASEAVRLVVAEAREFREKKNAELAAAAAKKKKKGKKGKADPVVAGAPIDENLPIEKVREENEELRDRLDGFFPKGPYIVIDTANNQFLMKNGNKIIVDSVCSTGSYSKLDAPDGRSWFFHTPRGSFRIRDKKKNPIWVKPDWAFWEEGEAPPSARHESRYEPYVMGDYALGFGNGYYIHGTLYNRLLGQSVTHGCVRLADEPLELVYNSAPIGTPIFIY